MKKHDRRQSISGLAALLSLGVFAVSLLAVLLCGAGVYGRLTQRDQLAYDSRTCVQYLTTKVRQAPTPDAVALSRFGDGDALIISEEIGGAEYWTRVYCYDGWLMELFTVADDGFAPEDGEQILPARELSLTREGTLLRVALVDGNGSQADFLLALRGGEEGAP